MSYSMSGINGMSDRGENFERWVTVGMGWEGGQGSQKIILGRGDIVFKQARTWGNVG